MPLFYLEHTIERGGSPTTELRLVDAKNSAQAIGHVAASSIKCSKATHQQAIECTKNGIEVERAGTFDPGPNDYHDGDPKAGA